MRERGKKLISYKNYSVYVIIIIKSLIQTEYVHVTAPEKDHQGQKHKCKVNKVQCLFAILV